MRFSSLLQFDSSSQQYTCTFDTKLYLSGHAIAITKALPCTRLCEEFFVHLKCSQVGESLLVGNRAQRGGATTVLSGLCKRREIAIEHPKYFPLNQTVLESLRIDIFVGSEAERRADCSVIECIFLELDVVRMHSRDEKPSHITIASALATPREDMTAEYTEFTVQLHAALHAHDNTMGLSRMLYYVDTATIPTNAASKLRIERKGEFFPVPMQSRYLSLYLSY